MKKVLFICIENSCRSQMAEAFARMYGAGVIEAYSSGSHPSGIVNPRAITFMAEVGYDLSTHHSKGLDEFKAVSFDYVLTMGCGDKCPWIASEHREDWSIADPKNLSDEEFRAVRDNIAARVQTMILNLQ
jgi:arsenate reductase